MSQVETRANPTAAGTPAVQSMLKQRIVTAAVLMIVLVACAFGLSSLAWQLLICIPVALAAHEWARLSAFTGRMRLLFMGALAATLIAFIAAWASSQLSAGTREVSRVVFVAALIFWAAVVPVWLYRGWRLSRPILLGAAGWMVLVPTWIAAVYLQKTPWLLMAVLLLIWTADTAAYFCGRSFGRHKLAPSISPGKTWEGVIGACVAVLIYALAASFLLQPSASTPARVATLILVTCVTALSILGDLFESWIKRVAGAKDSGTLLPGHGGVLDRIDSLTAALPLCALYFLSALGAG